MHALPKQDLSGLLLGRARFGQEPNFDLYFGNAHMRTLDTRGDSVVLPILKNLEMIGVLALFSKEELSSLSASQYHVARVIEFISKHIKSGDHM